MRLKVCEQILHVGRQLAHFISIEVLLAVPSRFELPNHSYVKRIVGLFFLPTDQVFLLTNTQHFTRFSGTDRWVYMFVTELNRQIPGETAGYFLPPRLNPMRL